MRPFVITDFVELRYAIDGSMASPLSWRIWGRALDPSTRLNGKTIMARTHLITAFGFLKEINRKILAAITSSLITARQNQSLSGPRSTVLSTSRSTSAFVKDGVSNVH